MERLADAAADRAHTRFIVSNDPDEVVEKIGWYVGLGFDHLVFHAPGEDQRALPRAVLRRRRAEAARARLVAKLRKRDQAGAASRKAASRS